jgi:polyphenol oxidase
MSPTPDSGPEELPMVIATPDLVREGWLWHGFSTRVGGVSMAYSGENGIPELNLGFTADDSEENVRENRLRFVEAVTGSRDTPLITVRQVHSDCSLVADAASRKAVQAMQPKNVIAGEADGLMTAQPGILLGIQTADCVPVLVADRKRRAVAAFHAGWRGTVQRIVERGIAQMRAEFGSEPGDMTAMIGPAIGGCCYAVGEELRREFRANFSYADELFSERQRLQGETALHLDLTEANRRQLMAAGLREDEISLLSECTSCQPKLFYSHRASSGHAGRLMSVIGIR